MAIVLLAFLLFGHCLSIVTGSKITPLIPIGAGAHTNSVGIDQTLLSHPPVTYQMLGREDYEEDTTTTPSSLDEARVSKNFDYAIPVSVKKTKYKGKKSGTRRNSISPNLAPLSPSHSTSSSSHISYAPTPSASQDSETIQGVFARWNPKINLTWPPTIQIGTSATSDYPEYHSVGHLGHHGHHAMHETEHHHTHHDPHHRVHFVPVPYCHHELKEHKKKEISLIWPLIILGLLFLPLLLGALLLPLAFMFISNIIQLINLLSRIPLTTTAQPTTGKRKKRSLQSFLSHPEIAAQIDDIAERLEESLQKFIKFLSD